mgnify:CR=1 FL=1
MREKMSARRYLLDKGGKIGGLTFYVKYGKIVFDITLNNK